MASLESSLSSQSRLNALYATNLLDTLPEENFDRITRLAAKALGVPMALISLVDLDRQFFKSCAGVPESQSSDRESPIRYSFCQHVVASREVVAINDARLDARVCSNPAVGERGVIAYLGAPLMVAGGEIIGTLCAVDSRPREWSDEQIKIIGDLAAVAMAEIECRRAAKAEMAAKLQLKQVELHFLADSMPQIVWTAKSDGRIDYYNKRWYEYTGMTFEQTRDWGWTPVLHPDDTDTCLQRWTDAIKTGQPYSTELRLKRAADGEHRWHLARGLPMRDADGTITQWVGTTTDIHNQKLHEGALERARNEQETRVVERTAQLQHEKRFVETILHNTTDGIIACDETGKLTIVNRAMQAIRDGNEKNGQDFVGGSNFNLCYADGVTPMSAAETPLARALRDDVIDDLEVVLAQPGKSKRRLLVNGRALIDADGLKFGAVVGVADITDRRAADAKFRTIFESSSDAHLLVDESGVLDCNAAAVKLFGCQKKSDLISIHPAKFSPEFQPDGQRSADKGRETDARARARGQHRFEWTHQRLDGKPVEVEVTLTVIQIDEKHALLAVCHDLTERKLAEDEIRRANASLEDKNLLLRQSDERFHAFMDNSPAVCFIKDEASRLLYVNQHFSKLFNQEPAALLGKSDFDFLDRSIAEQTTANDRLVLEKNRAIEVIESVPATNGDIHKWMSLKFPLTAPGGKKMLGGIAFDVTARLQAEAEMERQRRFTEAVLENVSDGIVACDVNGKITVANASIREITGIDSKTNDPASEWAAKNITLYLPQSNEPIAVQDRPMARALRQEPITWQEYQIRSADAPPLDMIVSSRPMKDGAGAMIGAVAVWRDVTNLRRSERELLAAKDAAESANHVKGEFLANMSHEIRTPMTSIIGYADMLSDGRHSEHDRREFVQIIRRNGEHLLCIINDILDLSKIDSGKMHVERMVVSPAKILAEIASSMRVRATTKNIGFDVHLSGDLPGTICTDPTRIRQVLLNLVSNAIKFTHVGRVDVYVTCDTQARTLLLKVVDTGIGLTPTQMSGLFQPFAQADTSTTRRFGGTGLGLAVSKRLVEMLGGTLDVHSEVGCGSTFSFSVQYHEATANSACTETPDRCELQVSNEIVRSLHARVLLAEDSADNRRLVRAYLEEAGMAVEFAGNGRIAVDLVMAEQANGTPFDCVLMDMQMPELDGYAATAELRHRGIVQLPIIAFTAHAMSSERDKCLSVGCDDYATKPVEPVSLINTIVRHIIRSRETQMPADALPLSSQTFNTHTAAEPAAPDVVHSEFRSNKTLARILPDYIDGLPALVSELSEHMTARNLGEARSIAHQLKGSGGSYGYPLITSHATAVEEAIKHEHDLTHIARQVNDLVDLMRRVAGYDRSKEAAASR